MGRALFRIFLRTFSLRKKGISKFLRLLMALGFLCFSFPSLAVLSVFDSSTYGLTSQMLSSFRETLNITKTMGNEIESMRKILGEGKRFHFLNIDSLLEREGFSLKDFSRRGMVSFGSLEDKTDFDSCRRNFEKFWTGGFDANGYMSSQSQEKVAHFREMALKESILNGMAFVAYQKEALSKALGDLTDISKEASRGTDLRSDTLLTNKLLGFIAYEILQERALLIQFLEMESAKEGMRLPIALEKRQLIKEGAL